MSEQTEIAQTDEQILSVLAERIPDLVAMIQAALWELWPTGNPGPGYRGPRPNSPAELFAMLQLDSAELQQDKSTRLYYVFSPALYTDGLFTLDVTNCRVEPVAFDT